MDKVLLMLGVMVEDDVSVWIRLNEGFPASVAEFAQEYIEKRVTYSVASPS